MPRPQMGQNGHHGHQNGHSNGAIREPSQVRTEVAPRVARPSAQFIPRIPRERGMESPNVATVPRFSMRRTTISCTRSRAYEKLRSARPALGLVVAIASFYGAVISGFEGWKFEKALFLAFTVLSTIGYGNYAPESEGARVFLAVFTLPGV